MQVFPGVPHFAQLTDTTYQVHNPLDADLILELVQSDGSVGGTTYAHFDQAFSNFVVPPGQTVNSGIFPNVVLTQGVLPSLGIIGQNLDVAAASTIRIGKGGYRVPWLKLTQTNVPTSYQLTLSLDALKTKAKQLNGTSSAVHSTPTSPTSFTSSLVSIITDSKSGNVPATSKGPESSTPSPPAAVVTPSNAPISA
jgi:hypothetical protein